MNQNQSQALISQLNLFKKVIFSEQKSANIALFKQLIRTELPKLLQNQPQGLDKNQLLILVEEIFGSKNFQNGKYKGGKEVIIETIHDFFGKENFSNGKFTGGWNEKQDTANIHKTFGEKNFTNGEYTGGWNQSQDLKNIQGEQNKAVISQIVEEKLGGSEKFADGKYKTEAETIKIAEKAFENEGLLLKKLQNIIGPDKFYSSKPGENIPQGREGMYKDDREIALLQAKYQAEIKATEDWLKFFKKHLIPSDKETIWRDKFGSNVDGAEDLYEDAKSKGGEILGEDFNDTEKRRIDKEAHSPEEIQKVLQDIPHVRKKLAWDKFFRDREGDSRINKDWEKNWRESELGINLAEKIYNNGWNNSPNGLINKEKIIETYTTKTSVKGQNYEKTTKNINPLKHLAEEVDQAHDFIVQRIDLETDLNHFPTDDEISGAFNEKKVPDTINHEELQNLRDNKIKSLFKQYFQGSSPTNLKDEQIELWRTSLTGLPNTGKDQRRAYDNGWTAPSEIENSQLKQGYQGISSVEVLKFKKNDIDNEITKVNNLVQKVSNFKHLRELDAIQKEIDQQFKELKREFLPPNKDQEITDIVKKQRESLSYFLTDKNDGGMEKTELETLLKKMNNRVWDAPNYESAITKVINQWLKADQGIIEMNQSLDEQIKEEKDPVKKQALEAQKLLQPGRGYEDLDTPNEKLYGTNEDGKPNSWMSSQKGYVIPDKIVQAEEKLPTEKRGVHLLRYFYEKAKDGKNRDFSPDKLNDEDAKKYCFCLPGKQTITYTVMERQGMSLTKKPVVKTKTIDVIGGDKGTQGHLAVAAGGGKTTKSVNDLVNGGKEHVILICPTPTLTESAFKHHTTWLQTWGCVYHKKSRSAWVLKGTLTEATEEEVKNGQAEPEQAELYESHGTYPVEKNGLVYWVDDKGNPKGKEEGKKGLSVIYFGNLLGYEARKKLVESGAINEWQSDNTPEWNAQVLEEIKIQIKDKLISKDSIIVFDEAHYNSGAYQALQLKMVQEGYKVLRMSATFPGVPFSTTSTYPKKSYYSGELDPNMPAGVMKLTKKQAENLATIRGIEPEEIKWQNDKGQPLPVEVKLEERFRVGKTLIFVKDLNISDEQKRIFGNKYSCVIFGPEFKEFCETVSFGRQPGAVMVVNFEHEMGLTFEADTVISTGLVEVSNLGKNFTYSEKTTQFVPISSLIQQQGRVGRIQWGLFITLTKKTQEIIIEEDVEAAMVKACFDGNIEPIKEAEYPFYDIKMLWGGLAHPHRFGKPPSEALIGLKVDGNEKDRVKNKQPLTKIIWRTEVDKGDLMKKGWFSSVIPDEELWKRYLGDVQTTAMTEEQAENLLKELITNFIAKDNRFPQGLNMRNQSNLIGAVYKKRLDKGQEEQKRVAEEIKNVLNGVIEKEIRNYVNTDSYNETNQCSKDPKVIKNIVDLYQLNNANVSFSFEENEEKKEVWTLNMKHNIIRT